MDQSIVGLLVLAVIVLLGQIFMIASAIPGTVFPPMVGAPCFGVISWILFSHYRMYLD